jgi:uncharacterized protein (DUF952 family)
MKVYHIVLPEDWEKFQDQDYFEAESLRTEGFIHCSFSGQLEEVLKRYYQGAKAVIILEIETDKLTSKLIKEPSTNDEVYPHIYGRINREAVVGVKEVQIEP